MNKFGVDNIRFLLFELYNTWNGSNRVQEAVIMKYQIFYRNIRSDDPSVDNDHFSVMSTGTSIRDLQVPNFNYFDV